MADREPILGPNRRSGEMQPVRPPLATPHSSHDLVLLAAAADRGADPSVRAAAADQAAACADCAALAADLRSLALGLADLPSALPAPRDMRLSVAQAARLRRGRFWRRLLRPLGGEGIPVLRPLAATLTTLGLAGILLSAFPLALGTGGAAFAPPDNAVGGAARGGSSSAVPAPAAAASAAPEQQATDHKAYISTSPQPNATAPGAGPSGGDMASNADRSPSPAFQILDNAPKLPPLAWVSLGLVGAGLGLFALLFVARRIV